MSDSGDRARRPGGKPDGQRPDRSGPRRGQPSDDKRPSRGADGPARPRAEGDKKPYRPRADGDRPARPAGDAARHDRSTGNPFSKRPERGGRDRDAIEDRDPYGIKSVRNRHDDPIIPDDVQAKDLDRVARAQLKTLSKENADEVARHLVMVARLIEEDAPLAYRHAVSAARRAGRIAVVRETFAIAAYSVGDFALALRELRTYRRISGRNDQLPMMVDSERGLGRPDKALELGRSVPRDSLPVEVQVELAIAMSGARLDLGQLDAALTELEIPQLNPNTAFSWSPALFDAYATVLEDLDRGDDAEVWWQHSDRASQALSVPGGGDEDETIEVVEEELPEDDAAEPVVLVEEERSDGAPAAGDIADEEAPPAANPADEDAPPTDGDQA